MTANSQASRFGSGNAVRRVEDDSLLTGRGQFADNFVLPGQAHLVFLRSPHAHARITALDVTAAKAMPGVVAVLTGEDLMGAGVKPIPKSTDFKRHNGGETVAPPQHVLAVGTVR
jgi:carbon-monoxide dehydrogenase large subunit